MVSDTRRVKGIDDVIATLRDLPPSMSRAVLRKAVRREANALLRVAKSLAPISNKRYRIKTRGGKTREVTGGHLRRAMFARTFKSGTNAVGAGVSIKSRAYYWYMLEFGTVRMPPAGFMRQTFDMHGPDTLENVAADIRQWLPTYIAKQRSKGRVR